MDSLLHSDIFFFITSIAVAIATIIFVIVGFYVIRAAKNFSDVSKMLKESTLLNLIFKKKRNKKE